MTQQESDRIVHGAIGGVIAGVVVILWFFVMDFVAGQPFDTPAHLSSAVLREDFSGPWPRLIMMFTVLHFGVFVGVGIAATWALNALHIKPGLIVGAVVGVGVLNAVHYAGLLITGTNLLTMVPVLQVLLANLLGGMMMMAYLHRAFRVDSPLGLAWLRRYPVLSDGLVTGLVGATAVAMWFVVVDLFAGAPLYTPAALGSAVLLGASSPAEVELNLGVMATYTVLHTLTFIAVGTGFAWLARQLHGAPDFGARALAVLVLLEGLFVGSVGMANGWIVQELGWLTILGANALAVVGMSAWIWHRNPQIGEADAELGVPAGV